MKKDTKINGPEYYRQIVLGLGSKVYTREELEARIVEIDRGLGREPGVRPAKHVSCVMKEIEKYSPELISKVAESTKKGSEIIWEIKNSTALAAMIANGGKKRSVKKEDAEAKKPARKPVTPTPSEQKKEKDPDYPVELIGKKCKKVEFPKVNVSYHPTTAWTIMEHISAYLIGGFIKIEGRGIGEGDLAKEIRKRRGIDITVDEVKALVDREPAFERNAARGVVVRLKKGDDGNDTWDIIKKAHDPKKFKIQILLRSTLTKKEIEDMVNGTVEVISSEMMVGCLYQITTSYAEEDIIKIAKLYLAISPSRGEFIRFPDPAYETWVNLQKDRFERLARRNSIECQIADEIWIEQAATGKRRV